MFAIKAELFAFLCIFCYLIKISVSLTAITSTQSLQDPGSILSEGGVFTLGFFSPNGSTDRYVGLWYSNRPYLNVLWVANRENPIQDSSGIMKIHDDGNLVIHYGKKQILWISNVTTSDVNATAKLSDIGDLMLLNLKGDTLWQSFAHISDTFLPKMRIFADKRTTNVENKFTSWKSQSDPSPGVFSGTLTNENISEFIVWNGNRTYWRSGPWNGRYFIGVPDMDMADSVYLDGFSLVTPNDGKSYLTYVMADNVSYFYLDIQGRLLETYWDDKKKDWSIVWSSIASDCDVYGKCGAFGVCDAKKSPICSCLKGFTPRNIDEWNAGNWTGCCVRKTPLNCTSTNSSSSQLAKTDGFLKMTVMKVPDFASWAVPVDGQCEKQCLSNCTCMAYAYDAGIGCLFWSVELIDLQRFPIQGADLYIRVSKNELGHGEDFRAIIAIAVVVGTILIAISVFCIWRRITKHRAKQSAKTFFSRGFQQSPLFSWKNMIGLNQGKFQELQVLSFESLSAATNDFSTTNKLGQGGFGPVYWGKLSDGQEIAVKRLSKASGQGLEEFLNELDVISKVQHRNLVRLLGCCVDGNEKMLVYEFMPNKSLDALLFDPQKKKELDWKKRLNIIDGICRGLLYLHRDSRLRIVHRDLKASNILLDEELNPRISDFGMARIFVLNEEQADTKRVVGTFGYMAPEYAMHGRFSEKSDVFSFGVLLLEIVSGRKNTSFYNNDQASSLIEFAWRLWNEDNIMPFIDPTMFEGCHFLEIMRCIHVGLLCVQDFAKDRPAISTIISMVNNRTTNLPGPKQPAFCERRFNPRESDSFGQSQNQNTGSQNEVTVTAVEGR